MQIVSKLTNGWNCGEKFFRISHDISYLDIEELRVVQPPRQLLSGAATQSRNTWSVSDTGRDPRHEFTKEFSPDNMAILRF